MSKHPLDISGFLGADQPDQKKERHAPKKKAPKKSYPSFSPYKSKAPSSPRKNEDLPVDTPKIQQEIWSQLNAESRKILSSRIWKGIDFNPMLGELNDLSKLSEKWLRWAIPTYVNGLKGGVIKDWIEGKRDDRDFHYILVGEHLRHLKEQRAKKKAESLDEASATAESLADEPKDLGDINHEDTDAPKDLVNTNHEETPEDEASTVETPEQENETAALSHNQEDTEAAENTATANALTEPSAQIVETEALEQSTEKNQSAEAPQQTLDIQKSTGTSEQEHDTTDTPEQGHDTTVSSEQDNEITESPEQAAQDTAQEGQPKLEKSLEELDDNIRWFEEYIAKKSSSQN
ncbi:MAG: hypothetical protein HQL32_01740 [Planctomycetes bacterium]|nr:hypothetical protein [Planctomycetota bacterium]